MRSYSMSQHTLCHRRRCYSILLPSYLLHDLHHIFIIQHMVLSDALRSVLGTNPPHQRVLELVDERFVNSVTKVGD